MPLLDLFWTMLMIFLWSTWIIVVFNVVIDIFRNHDTNGLGWCSWPCSHGWV